MFIIHFIIIFIFRAKFINFSLFDAKFLLLLYLLKKHALVECTYILQMLYLIFFV